MVEISTNILEKTFLAVNTGYNNNKTRFHLFVRNLK